MNVVAKRIVGALYFLISFALTLLALVLVALFFLFPSARLNIYYESRSGCSATLQLRRIFIRYYSPQRLPSLNETDGVPLVVEPNFQCSADLIPYDWHKKDWDGPPWFASESYVNADGVELQTWSFPEWFVWPILLLPISVTATRYYKQRRVLRIRRRDGLCVHCGYDLRGSAGRCPECGTLPGPKAGQKHAARHENDIATAKRPATET